MEFDPSLPLEKARTAPSRWYHAPEILAAEENQVFRHGWHYAGVAQDVLEPGAYFTARIGRQPIIVARDLKGRLAAMANVCRHKAAVIMTAPRGKAACFQCRYHGWTYDLGGSLRSTPEFEGVQDFCKEAHPLPRFAVETLGPLVFVSLQKDPPPLRTFFGPFVTQMEGQALGDLVFARRVEYDLKCNWKVFVDNYLDGGYHVNTLHPALAGVIDYSQYRTEIFDHCSLQTSPLVSTGGVANVRKGQAAYYWWLYPAFMVNSYEGVMDTNLVVPTGPETCRVYFDYFFAAGTDPAFIDESIRVAHQVQLEDQDISERVQLGLASGSYDTGRFSVKREIAAHHFHRRLAQDLIL